MSDRQKDIKTKTVREKHRKRKRLKRQKHRKREKRHKENVIER